MHRPRRFACTYVHADIRAKPMYAGRRKEDGGEKEDSGAEGKFSSCIADVEVCLRACHTGVCEALVPMLSRDAPRDSTQARARARAGLRYYHCRTGRFSAHGK